MEFCDGNEWHRVTDRSAYEHAGLPMLEFRAMSASTGTMVYDKAFADHRSRFTGLPFLIYQYPYGKESPEKQAEDLAVLLGQLGPLEMVMLDIEAKNFGISDPAEFTRRWLARFEGRLGGHCWVYLPKALATPGMYDSIGERVIKAPRYSGHAGKGPPPDWRHDVWQFSDRAPMPGSPDGPGGRNTTTLSVADLLARSGKGAAPDGRRRRQQALLL
jgi:hypothetical protein